MRRLPIKLKGTEAYIWVNYQIEACAALGTCVVCGKEENVHSERVVGEPVVETNDPELENILKQKIIELVDQVERKMSVC